MLWGAAWRSDAVAGTDFADGEPVWPRPPPQRAPRASPRRSSRRCDAVAWVHIPSSVGVFKRTSQQRDVACFHGISFVGGFNRTSRVCSYPAWSALRRPVPTRTTRRPTSPPLHRRPWMTTARAGRNGPPAQNPRGAVPSARAGAAGERQAPRAIGATPCHLHAAAATAFVLRDPSSAHMPRESAATRGVVDGALWVTYGRRRSPG